MLVLTVLAQGRAAIVSRGELVEIGGGFRVPEVMAASGADLVEVGATNRTRLSDYERAVDQADGDAVVLKVHQSNYRIEGFTASVDIASLSRLGAPVVYDIGSGLLDARTPWLAGPTPTWLSGEPAARQSIGVRSRPGDLLGRQALRRTPGGDCRRALRSSWPDVRDTCWHGRFAPVRWSSPLSSTPRSCTCAATVSPSRSGGWRQPTRRTSSGAPAGELGVGDVVACSSVAGAGSVPGLEIASAGVSLPGDRTAALRELSPPVIARAQHGRTVCDLRTVDSEDDGDPCSVVEIRPLKAPPRALSERAGAQVCAVVAGTGGP